MKTLTLNSQKHSRSAKQAAAKKAVRNEQADTKKLAAESIEDFAGFLRKCRLATYIFIAQEKEGCRVHEVGPSPVSALALAGAAMRGEAFVPLYAIPDPEDDEQDEDDIADRRRAVHGIAVRLEELMRPGNVEFILIWTLRGDLAANVCCSHRGVSWKDVKFQVETLLQDKVMEYLA